MRAITACVMDREGGQDLPGAIFLPEASDLGFAAALILLAALITLGMIARARRGKGVIDVPGARSSHDRPTPKGGGVGIAVASLAGAALAPLAGWPVDWQLWAILLPASLLAGFAYLDDARDFPALSKLAVQAATALALVLAGPHLPDAWFAPLTGEALAPAAATACALAWVLFVTNAVNFIDGLNGLASGAVGLTALLSAGLIGSQFPGTVRTGGLLLAVGVAGFLPFNFPKARIFMGDVGSQFLGMAIAGLALAATAPPGCTASIGGTAITGCTLAPRLVQIFAGDAHGRWAAALIPFCLLGILTDVAFTLVRRALAGDRLTQAHRGHLYQLAQRSFMRARSVTVVHWSMVLWGAWVWNAAFILRLTSSPRILVLLLAPQIFWTIRVLLAARLAAIGRW